MPYANPRKAKQYALDHYRRNAAEYKRRATERNRRVKYGVMPEAYEVLLQIHNERCGICRRTAMEIGKGGRSLHIDHDHTTSRVRGLLCNNCNTGLGLFGDSSDRLEAARKYLNRN